MKAGRPDARVTVRQAAGLLNASPSYVASLLETGQVPSSGTGRRRRIAFEALMEYKRQDDLERRAAAGALSDLSQELGLY